MFAPQTYESESSQFRMGMDRRASGRFPIEEEIRYRPLDRRNAIVEGAGKTVNMSRGGVLFSTAEPLVEGGLIELSVNWPAQLDGVCPLQFVAKGHVLRSEGALCVVTIEHYQFKTRRKTAAAVA